MFDSIATSPERGVHVNLIISATTDSYSIHTLQSEKCYSPLLLLLPLGTTSNVVFPKQCEVAFHTVNLSLLK